MTTTISFPFQESTTWPLTNKKHDPRSAEDQSHLADEEGRCRDTYAVIVVVKDLEKRHGGEPKLIRLSAYGKNQTVNLRKTRHPTS